MKKLIHKLSSEWELLNKTYLWIIYTNLSSMYMQFVINTIVYDLNNKGYNVYIVSSR